MTLLWAPEEFLTATGGRPVGVASGPIGGISIDSRTLAPGDAFFAIAGNRTDGHDFVSMAIAKGASLAVIADGRLAGLPPRGRYIVVDDVLGALGRVALAARARTKARIAAVTGSVGKTGTKEMLRLALAAAGKTHASVASYNNHWGVPLSLARLPKDAAFGVFEIGMNAPGEITPLVRMVRPHAAIVTTVVSAHAAGFASEEEIADAKAEIMLGVEPGGAAILNADNRHFDRLAAAAEAAGIETILSFGEAENAVVRLVSAELSASGSSVEADVAGDIIAYRVGAPGRHLVMNSLAVLAAAHALGADIAAAAAALAGFAPPPGRGVRHPLAVKGGEALLLDESYNANPTSMRAAIEVLALAETGTGGRRIAVLGDMLELGAEAASLHAGLSEPLVAAGIDRVHCAGPLMRSLYESLPESMRGAYAETAAGIESAVTSDVAAGDVVMVKGSNGSRMGAIAAALRARAEAIAGARGG